MSTVLDLAAHALWAAIALTALAFVVVLVVEHVQTIHQSLTTAPKETRKP